MSFESLVRAKGFTLNSLAVRLGCSPLLLERVSQKRQPLAHSLVKQIATVIGSDVGTVEFEVGFVTRPGHVSRDENGNVIPGNDQTLLNPHPPIPELGDKF